MVFFFNMSSVFFNAIYTLAKRNRLFWFERLAEHDLLRL